MKSILLALGSLLFVAFFAITSVAQVQRTFVSGGGSDSNPCNRTAPCRNFAQAISQTSAGGEVVVLDSAGYGAFAITQAVSITAPAGVYAGISVFSGNGININAGMSDTVILRGLSINNQGSTGSGIVFNAGGTLHVEGCVINGFATTNAAAGGIIFQAGASLEVKDSIIRGNFHGIVVASASGSAHAAVDQVRLEENLTDGLVAEAGSTVTVSNSVASGNQTGFSCVTNTSAAAELNIENCAASNNGAGIRALSQATGVATVRVSNSTVTDNGTGLQNLGSPAVLLSRGNNTVEGNTTADTTGTIGSYGAN
jgi:hypothetical protein